MPVDYFEDYKDQLAKYESVVVYCNTGNSSAMFYKRAEHAGYDNVVNLT